MTKSMLLICICSVVFHHCAGEETIVRGFIGLNTLRRKAVLQYDSVEWFQQQRILPSVNFSCSGNISKWTFVARSRTGKGRDQYPLFQLWRPSGTARYVRVYESSSDGGTFTASEESGITIGEYVPHDLVPFRSGDVLGVYQPGDYSDSRLSLMHVNVPSGFGHDNYYIRQTGMSLAVFTTSAQGVLVGNKVMSMFPSYNTQSIIHKDASSQCVQGFLNEEAVRIAADMYATSDTYSVRTHERQQHIIPGIKFTCNGTLTKWMIGAQITVTEATNPQHLQLQIWRLRQGSNNTYDRTNHFSDITEFNTTDDLNVYEYIPNPPLEFRANDFLGLYQPRLRHTEVEVYYQSGGGPRNFVRSNRDSPVTRNFITGGGVDNDLPLVTVEGNGESAGDCSKGFITKEKLANEALLIGNFAEMYGQQMIIPNMTFTSSGSILRWTFAAQYNASATQYPELQVWRENTTGTYVKVGSTGNMEPIQTAYLNVYEYVLDLLLQVLAGDVLGIYQPSSRDSCLHLLFSTDSNHVNWYTNAPRPQDSFMVADSPTNNVFPLVALSFELDETATPVRSSSEVLVPTTLPNPGGISPPGTSTSALSLPPTPGSDRSPVNETPAGAIAGALVGVAVAAIAVVLLVVLLLRKRQRKHPHEPDTQEETLDNPIYTGSTELNASVPDEVKLELFEMNTNDAYVTNTVKISTTGNVAYMTAGDIIPATQNVAYEQVLPGTDECYDYVI